MKKFLLFVWTVILLVTASFLLWTQFYYEAETDALSLAMNNPELRITEEKKTITITPVNKRVKYTFIFYPWAKVDAPAYLAKLWKIATDHSVKIIISKPLLHLQIFDINAATDISWENIIIGGHSLGGSMACEYASNHPDNISGMILFWSYCNSNISELWIKTLVFSASHDGLLSPSKIKSYQHNLGSDNTFFIINGAVHAQFWNYGPQKGDGASTLTDEEVVTQISEQVGLFLESLEK